MGLEAGTSIAALDAVWPLGSDPENQGDDHIRLIKAVLKTTFPGVGGNGFATPITATESQLNFVDLTSSAQIQLTALTTAIANVIAGIQSQAYTYSTTGGASGAFTLSTTPAITAYAPGQRFSVKFSADGNGADTLSIDSLATTQLFQYNPGGYYCAPVIKNGMITDVEYDGLYFIILNPLPPLNAFNAGQKTGLTLEVSGSTIVVNAGTCVDSTNSYGMAIVGTGYAANTSVFTTGITGSGGLMSGTILNNTWYAVYLISSTAIYAQPALLFAPVGSSLTLPTGYTIYRYLGCALYGTTGWVPYVQTGDYFEWKTPVIDVNNIAASTATVNKRLSVPPIKAIAKIAARTYSTSVLITDPDIGTQTLPTDSSSRPLGNLGVHGSNQWFSNMMDCMTDSYGTINYVASQAGNFNIVTHGWFDLNIRD